MHVSPNLSNANTKCCTLFTTNRYYFKIISVFRNWTFKNCTRVFLMCLWKLRLINSLKITKKINNKCLSNIVVLLLKIDNGLYTILFIYLSKSLLYTYLFITESIPKYHLHKQKWKNKREGGERKYQFKRRKGINNF